MVQLVLTPTCDARLRSLLELDVLPAEVVIQLRTALFVDVRPDGSEKHAPRKEWVEHGVVVKVSRELRQRRGRLVELGKDPRDFTLDALVRGSEVYFPPPPPRHRSAELEAILSSIRLRHDRDLYASMLSTRSSHSLFSLSPALNSSLIPSLDPSSPSSSSAVSEGQAWRQARQQLAAVTNVLFSGMGVAFAVWYATGSAGWRVESRVGTSMLGAVVVVAAEAFLYARFLAKSSVGAEQSSKEQQQRRRVDAK